MRPKLVVGNWKMHGSLSGNKNLLQGLVAGVGAIGEVSASV